MAAAALALLLAIVFPRAAHSQQPARAAADSITAGADTSLAVLPAEETGLAAPIYYTARRIDNDIVHRITVLLGEAQVKYQSMTIEAGKITVDLNRRILTAEALPETVRVAPDSLDGNGIADSVQVRMVGYPVFADGANNMRGERMKYNFTTGRGMVERGRTDFEGGKYFGRRIKRVNPKVLFVSRGTYTTCELEDHPHYHFWSRRMKIIIGERVIAKPIVLFFGKIPVALLPFGMFPTQKGRRSGIIVPRYGVSAREGRYLRELGYYWAASDYFDLRASVDFYEKSGWLFKAGANYALRYNFTGSISGSLTRKNFAGGERQRRWDLSIRHNQTLGKTANLGVNATFISDNSYYRDFSFNQYQRLTRRLRSQATFSKRWTKLRSSLSISASNEKDLQDGSVTQLLPSVQFYLNERRLFGGGSQRGGKTPRGGVADRWYQNIYFRYNVNLQSSYQKLAVEPDSGRFETDRRSTASHDISLRMSSPGKLFGWLRLSQSLNIDEDWFDRENVYQDSTLKVDEKKGFFARHTFSYQASANTTLYGIFNAGIGPICAFRHVMTPSISFSYRPDFAAPQWGYYVNVVDASGKTVKRDRFSGTPRGKLASMSISVANQFQMKLQQGKEEKKIELFRLNFSTGYNFAAAEKKLSRLNTTINARPSQRINFNMSMSHSPYVFDPESGREINRYLWKQHGILSGKWLRLVNLSVSSNFSLQSGGASVAAPQSGIATQGTLQRFEEVENVRDYSIPWRLSFSFRYSLSKFDPRRPQKRAYIDISQAEFKLSKNWRISFRGQFDLVKKQMVGQYWSIYRDLHCWEASFNWTPIGFGRGFFFRINIKAPQLQDIKFEKHGGRSSIFGGSYFY